MERKAKKESFLEKTAEVFDIPGEVVGMPRLEVIGRRALRMTNHKGILACGQEEIVISGGRLMIRVCGTELELKAMNMDELLITGTIRSVELT